MCSFSFPSSSPRTWRFQATSYLNPIDWLKGGEDSKEMAGVTTLDCLSWRHLDISNVLKFYLGSVKLTVRTYQGDGPRFQDPEVFLSQRFSSIFSFQPLVVPG